jgi:hypothetical protein
LILTPARDGFAEAEDALPAGAFPVGV